MNKLLRILSVISLVATANINIVACEEEIPTPPAKIDISNKITSPINLGQLSANTAQDFLTKLHKRITKIPILENIKTDDYDVYKFNTSETIKDIDIIANNTIVVDINIKTISPNFFGIATNISVKYIKNQKKEIIDLNSPVDSITFKDDDLYAGCHDRYVYKINKITKLITKTVKLVSSIESLVLIDNNLYIGCENAVIYTIIDITIPKPIINNFITLGLPENSSVYSLTFKENFLYAGTQNYKIYKINLQTKEKEEIIDLNSPVYGMTFKDDDLYASCANGKIFKINPHNKDHKIIVKLDSPIYDLVFKDDDLYAGTYYGKIFKIDINQSIPIKTELIGLNSSVFGLVFKDNDLYAGCKNGKIFKILKK